MAAKDQKLAARVVLARRLARNGGGNDALAHLATAIAHSLDQPDLAHSLLLEAIAIATENPDAANINVLAELLRRGLPQLPYLHDAWQRLMTVLGRIDAVRDSLAAQPGTGELRRIVSVRDWAMAHGGEWRETGLPETVPLGHCNAAGRGEIAGTRMTDTPYLACLPDVIVRGYSSLLYDHTDAVITDLLAHPQYGRYADMQYDKTVLAQGRGHLLVQRPVPDAQLPEGIWMTGLGSDQFGHWFGEFLPKLLYYEAHPRVRDLPLIIDADMPQQHVDFLHAMAPNPIHVLPRGSSLAVGRLWVAPTTTFRPVTLFANHALPVHELGTLVPSVLRAMRERVLAALPDRPDGPRRLYLSRRKRAWRLLLNEDDLIARMAQLGFTVVYLEDMSFAEQVAAFRHAECVVAPASSAVNNLVFAPPGVKTILIQGPGYNSDTMIGPFMALGYDNWTVLVGEPAARTPGWQDNTRIDPERVIHCVREACQMGQQSI